MITIVAEVDTKAVTPGREEMEAVIAQRLYAALQAWGRALFKDVTAETAPIILSRLDDPWYRRPMRDALIAALQAAAELGVAEGRGVIERDTLGVKRAPVEAGVVNWELANVDAARWAIEYGALLMTDLTDVTRRAVAQEIAYFIENGLTINQLRDRLMALDSTFSMTRATRIAVTETTRAYAEGNMAAWNRLPYVESIEWQTANDELVCPFCGPLHGEVVRKGELFGGRYSSPPAHVNCRCSISPVVTGDDDRGPVGLDIPPVDPVQVEADLARLRQLLKDDGL